MAAGLLVCVAYMLMTHTFFGGGAELRWFGIAPISAGVFGVPAGVLALVVVSHLSRARNRRTDGLVDYVRAPE